MCNKHLYRLLVSYITRKAVPLVQRLQKKRKIWNNYYGTFIGIICYKNPSLHAISLHQWWRPALWSKLIFLGVGSVARFRVSFTAQVIMLPFQNHCQGAVTSAENSKYYSSLKVNRSVTKHPFLPEGDAVLSQYLKASDNFQIDSSRSASGFVSCRRWFPDGGALDGSVSYLLFIFLFFSWHTSQVEKCFQRLKAMGRNPRGNWDSR